MVKLTQGKNLEINCHERDRRLLFLSILAFWFTSSLMEAQINHANAQALVTKPKKIKGHEVICGIRKQLGT